MKKLYILIITFTFCLFIHPQQQNTATKENSLYKTNSAFSWSALGAGANGVVYAVAVSGSDVYIGGSFTSVDGVAANHIAKWNGSYWSALGIGADANVYAIAVNGSNVYAGGSFTSIGGTAAKYIAKWNGASWFDLGGGATNVVQSIAASGSNVYAAGNFKKMGGIVVNGIAKWDGASWSSLGTGANTHPVYSVAVNGSDVYACGDFTTIGGVAANGIAKWNGSSWSALGNGITDNTIYTITVNGSDIYAGGYFTTIGGVAANYIAKWNGVSWSPLGTGVSGGGILPGVLAIAVYGSDVYAGSNFTTIGGVSANYIAKWNGNYWQPIGAAINNGVNDYVYCLAIQQTTGSMIVGGGFSDVNEITNGSHIAMFTDADDCFGYVAPMPVNGKYIISAPNGNEKIVSGSYYNINWRKTGGIVYGTIQIEYSIDGGETWVKINKTPIAGLTRYSWSVPKVNSTNCLVRVSNYTTHQVFDVSDKAFTITTTTGVKNYPNPFNPSTKIVFGLENKAQVSLKVFNSIGQQVAELVNKQLEAGNHEYEFNASNLTSGVYFYNLSIDGKSQVNKMILMK
jgi:hypothetical protein